MIWDFFITTAKEGKSVEKAMDEVVQRVMDLKIANSRKPKKKPVIAREDVGVLDHMVPDAVFELPEVSTPPQVWGSHRNEARTDVELKEIVEKLQKVTGYRI